MKLKEELENKIEEIVNKDFDIRNLKDISERISDKYMNEERSAKTLLSSKEDVVAYSLFRMPATYAAISKVFEYMNEIYDFKNELFSMVDIGSGTGSSQWASLDYFDINDFYLLERDKNMIDLSKELFSINVENDRFKNINFYQKDFLNLNDEEYKSLNKDLCITSYMINEFTSDKKEDIINSLINLTGKVLVVIEPGTPEGFNNIKIVKKLAVEKGLKTIAPCVFYDGECNLPKDEWCKVRVERSKIQKYIKSGSLGYEDEKFSYIVLVKEELYNKIKRNNKLRILRHPNISSGLVRLKVCDDTGKIFEDIITKKDKDLFKEIKKKRMGDSYEKDK